MIHPLLRQVKNLVRWLLWGGKVQSRSSLERLYRKVDPWGYRQNPDDQLRKDKILAALGDRQFKRALDLGCGEGWITQDLPAEEIVGVDISSQAIERARQTARGESYITCDLNKDDLPEGLFDLIVATGVLYSHYIVPRVLQKIMKKLVLGGYFLSCHIKDWEQFQIPLSKIHEEEFTYRGRTEHLVLYRK